MSQEVLELNLPVGKSTYKLKVSAIKESQIRLGLTTFNSIYKKYADSYPGQAEHDYLSMALIEFLADQQISTTTDSSILEALKAIDSQL